MFVNKYYGVQSWFITSPVTSLKLSPTCWIHSPYNRKNSFVLSREFICRSLVEIMKKAFSKMKKVRRKYNFISKKNRNLGTAYVLYVAVSSYDIS